MNSSDKLKASFKISLRMVAGDQSSAGAEKQTPAQIGQAIERLVASLPPIFQDNMVLLKTEYCNESFEVDEKIFELSIPDGNNDFKQNYWIETK